MNEDDKKFESMKEEARYKVISLDSSTSNEKKTILDQAIQELDTLFEAFKKWKDENVDSEELNARYEKLKADSKVVIEKAKVKMNEFNNREDVIKGKEKLTDVSDKVFNYVEDGLHDLMENEYVSKTVDTIGDTITMIREDERVKANVKKLKKGTLHLAEKAFNGLQRVLDTDEKDK